MGTGFGVFCYGTAVAYSIHATLGATFDRFPALLIPLSAKSRIEYHAVDHTPGTNKDLMADKLVVDSLINKWENGKANFWQGPKNVLPAEFTLELAEQASLDNVIIRNGRTTEWRTGTKV